MNTTMGTTTNTTTNATIYSTMLFSQGEDFNTFQPYPSAIILAIFSLLFALLIFPPMLWHLSNRNVGATSLILWLMILNLQDFLNAILWSHDDTAAWFQGYVVCDIEVKIMVAATVGVPSSVACVLRALARVMNTERTSLGLTKAQKRRGYAIDLLWCVGFPVLEMPFHYIVQTRRYYVFGISGCTPAVSRSWVADLLLIAPPAVSVLIGGYYAVLVLFRMHRYRRNFTALLATSNTNKSRFVRLFAICIFWLMVSIPLQIVVISQQAAAPHTPFLWDEVHASGPWNTIDLIPSHGQISYNRYIWLAGAFMVFLFFGFGRDASKMYAKGLRAVGLDKCMSPFHGTDRILARSTSQSGTINFVSSKARLFFERKSSSASVSTKSWATASRSSKATASSLAEPLSPKTMTHLEPAQEGVHSATVPTSVAGTVTSRLPGWLGGHQHATADVEKNPVDTPMHAGFRRLTSPFRSVKVVNKDPDVPFHNILRTHDVVVRSTAAADRV